MAILLDCRRTRRSLRKPASARLTVVRPLRLQLTGCIVLLGIVAAAGRPVAAADSESYYSIESLQADETLAPPVVIDEAPFFEREPEPFDAQPRPGILQQLFHATTRIPADADQLGLTELDFSATLGFPLPTREAPLLITPAFRLDLLDPDGLDLPEELYGASVEFRHLRPLTSRWTADLAITPGDFGNTESSASEFRLQGRAVGIYQWRTRAQAVLGVAYLDREDVPLLPVAGLLWTPHDGLQVDALFPRPKVALRAFQDAHSDWWLHLRGEFGGGSWGVTRASGTDDVATLRDVRLIGGIERRCRGVSLQLETGYVFGRDLEYASGLGDTSLRDAALVRAALWY